MPQTNIDQVTIYDEVDLTPVTTLDNDPLHVTKGKKISKADLITDLGIEGTDLTSQPFASSVIIHSSTGIDGTIAAATTVSAGVMTAADKAKLDGIEANASADQSPQDIVAAVNLELGSTNWQSGGAGGTDDQTATEVLVTPAGNLTSTNVQAALEELQGDVDTLSANTAGELNIQSDWNENDTNSDAHILNRPTTITTAQANEIAANTLKVTAHPLIDDDTLATATATNVASAESIKAYVDTNSGATPFTKQTFISNRVKVWGKAGSIVFTESVGVGQLTVANFGDISHASIALVDGVSYPASGDYTLRITFSDNLVNTWTPITNDVNSINDQDIYIPKLEAYGVNLPFFTGAKEVNQLNSGTTPVIPSSITWDTGTLIMTFTDSSSFGGNDRVILQLDFPKL